MPDVLKAYDGTASVRTMTKLRFADMTGEEAQKLAGSLNIPRTEYYMEIRAKKS